jgi:hypothetical protein
MNKTKRARLVPAPGQTAKLQSLKWLQHFTHNGNEFSKTGLRLGNKIGVFDNSFNLSWLNSYDTVLVKENKTL